jgi:glycerol-3-phosphate dehydrogenase
MPVLTRTQDHDQKITRSDLLNAMQNMGYDASEDRADGILREVDFGRKGEIDFQDYLDVSTVYRFRSALRLMTTTDRCGYEGAAARLGVHTPCADAHDAEVGGGQQEEGDWGSRG